MHTHEDAAVNGFQTVTNVRQRAPHDNAHGVIEVRIFHLIFDVGGNNVAAVNVSPVAAGGGIVWSFSRRDLVVAVTVLKNGFFLWTFFFLFQPGHIVPLLRKEF